jgi:hypothetical protein
MEEQGLPAKDKQEEEQSPDAVPENTVVSQLSREDLIALAEQNKK